MMYDVEVSVMREVRADSQEEAEAIARSLVLVMPHINERTCPTDPEVNVSATELEDNDGRKPFANLGPALEFAGALCGQPYAAPGYNAPTATELAVTAPLFLEDPDEPHPDLVDLPEAPSTCGTYAIVDDGGQVRARYDAISPEVALDLYMAEAPSPVAEVAAILEQP